MDNTVGIITGQLGVPCIACGNVVPLTKNEEMLFRRGHNLPSKMCDRCKNAMAEIERLKDMCANCSMLKGKIETISELNEQIEYWQRGYNNLRQELKTAKAEARKELAEQIKMAFYYEFDEIIPSIMADKIDELVRGI